MSVWLLAAVVLLGRLVPSYEPKRDSISALGGRGSPCEALVSYAVFLPVGLCALALGLLLGPAVQTVEGACAATLAGSIAVGYLAAAVAHWDPNPPHNASALRRNLARLHWLAAMIEYGGGASALIVVTSVLPWPWASLSALGALVVVLSGLALERKGLAPWRGAIQRVAEAVLFGALAWMSHAFV